jgi:DNA polymerase elongation subunit (family B)
MKIIVLDVETVTDRHVPKDPDNPKFPNVTYHDPLVITWLKVCTQTEKAHVEEHYFDSDRADEWLKTALSSLAVDIVKADRLVTFNGRRFDMPLLQLQAWRLGLSWKFWQGLSHRYPRYNAPLFHYDLMDIATDTGAAMAMSLDDLCKFFDLPGKGDMDGSKVTLDAWEENSQAIIDHCLDDVVQTWLCAVKMLGLGNDVARWSMDKLSTRLEGTRLESWFGDNK